MKQFLSVALIFTMACGSSSETAPTDTATDISQDADTQPIKEHHPAWGSPLPQVALPTFGQALHVGTQAIEFTDISLEAGLPIEGGANTVTFADFDSDGWPDIVASADNGFSFYRNVGGKFEEITDELLLFDSEKVRKSGTLAVFADIDGNGALDVYVAARGGADQLLVNDGYGHFELHEASAVLDPSESVQGVHFADINNDGLLDLYVTEGRRVDADNLEPPLENGFAGLPNKLFLGDGSFHFENVTSEWNAAAGAASESFGGLFADMDRDGDQDLFAIRDFARDHYFQNEGGNGFLDHTEKAVGLQVTSLMGLAVGDYNGDGHLDYYATNNTHDYLYRGKGDGRFDEVYLETLDGADPTSTLTGWGCAFVDLDNDGDQDVISVASYEFSESGAGIFTPARIGAFVVLENVDGKFKDITAEAGLAMPVNGTSLAIADIDHDGDMDFLVALEAPLENGLGPDPNSVPFGVRLYRNDSARAAGNKALELSLRSENGTRFGVGAIIDVVAGNTRSSQVITAGSSYLSAHNYVQHFGLGVHNKADSVTISWPDGNKQTAHNVPAGYHRMLFQSGDCCFEGASCEGELPLCPLWTNEMDACDDPNDCDICTEICGYLTACGWSDNECYGECSQSQPTDAELECAEAANCNEILACLDE